jgi:hypothetical protein
LHLIPGDFNQSWDPTDPKSILFPGSQLPRTIFQVLFTFGPVGENGWVGPSVKLDLTDDEDI